MKPTEDLAELIRVARARNSSAAEVAQAAYDLVNALVDPRSVCPVGDPECERGQHARHEGCQPRTVRAGGLFELPAPDHIESNGTAYWDDHGTLPASVRAAAKDGQAAADLSGVRSHGLTGAALEQLAALALAAAEHAGVGRG